MRIGRSKNCEVCFNENTLSKIHANLKWDENINKWKLIDGKDINSPSTNGTWLYAAHSYEINDNTVCKIGSSRIKISYQ